MRPRSEFNLIFNNMVNRSRVTKREKQHIEKSKRKKS